MSSFCDGIELKVTGFDKTEEEVRARGFELPEISYITCFEQYYPQTLFSWDEEEVSINHGKTTTKFMKTHYLLLTALMPNLERILVDGRCAPYETCFSGHYLDECTQAVTYVIKEIDNDTGEEIYKQEIDTIPNIIHNVDKYEEEHKGEVKYISNKDDLLSLMNENRWVYEFADPVLKEDEELAFMAVERCGDNYKFILDKYKLQRKFQLAAVISNSSLFHSLPKEVLSDFNFLLEACKGNKNCFNYVKDEVLKKQLEEVMPELVEAKRPGRQFGGFTF